MPQLKPMRRLKRMSPSVRPSFPHESALDSLIIGGCGESPNVLERIRWCCGVDAKAALAFVARREGRRAMEPSRWAHVMSLELGWMPPGAAKRYVEACIAARLLTMDGDEAAVTFDPKTVDVPRGRPHPDDLPEPRDAPEPTPAGDVASEPAPAEGDGFEAWLERVAATKGTDAAGVLAEVADLQDRTGGLLHAEAALFRIAAEAGLDVRDAAATALKRMQA